jgi:hypothetical protein
VRDTSSSEGLKKASSTIVEKEVRDFQDRVKNDTNHSLPYCYQHNRMDCNEYNIDFQDVANILALSQSQ